MGKLFLLVVVSVALCGCYQASSDDDLRAVPVTNNPYYLPIDNGQTSAMNY